MARTQFIDIKKSKDLKKLSDKAFLIGMIDLLLAQAYISPAMWDRYLIVIRSSQEKVTLTKKGTRCGKD